MKNVCRVLVILLGFITPLCCLELTDEIKSEIVLLMNTQSGRVLYEKNADQATAPASTTKVATALYALKELNGELGEEIKAEQVCLGSITAEAQKGMDYRHPPHWLIIGGTHLSISKGDIWTLEDLIYGLMLSSANDAGNMIAKYVSGSISQFMVDLNDYLESIGCKNTHFKNCHGLHLPGHKTTAYDMAIMTLEALKIPKFREVISTPKYVRPNTPKGSYPPILNGNMLIRSESAFYYPKAVGGKTGMHSDALACLITVARFKDRELLAVMMKSPTLQTVFQDTKAVFEAAFKEEKIEMAYLKKGLQPFKYQLGSNKKVLQTHLKEDVILSYFPSEKPHVKGEVKWLCQLPVRVGDKVAEITLIDELGNVLKQAPLYAQNKIKEPASKAVKGWWWAVTMITIVMSAIFLRKSFQK